MILAKNVMGISINELKMYEAHSRIENGVYIPSLAHP